MVDVIIVSHNKELEPEILVAPLNCSSVLVLSTKLAMLVANLGDKTEEDGFTSGSSGKPGSPKLDKAVR